MELFNKLVGTYIYGEEEEETPEQRLHREKRQAKLRVLSQTQRNGLLEELKTSIEELLKVITEAQNQVTNTTTMESTDDAKSLVLNDDLPIVTRVCENIDRCCCHGLRHVEGDETHFVRFFGLLKWSCARLQSIHQQRMLEGVDDAGSSRYSRKACQLATSSMTPKLSRDVRGYLGCMRTIVGLTNVKTDEGKARAFYRQALNMHILQQSLRAVLQEYNKDLLMSYYTEYALFRQPEDAVAFLSLLDGFHDMSFGFMVDDVRLDLPHESLPFTQPLPKPCPQPVRIAPPELIDPEDMLEGRVRLSTADPEAAVVAQKLVAHQHLGKNYDNSSGGNPLAEILRSNQTAVAIDDAATAVFRFLEIGAPEYYVFGSYLEDVICNPFLCGMARFDTSMGLPDVVEACICFLHRKLQTPGLFQVHLGAEHVMDLRDAIEELGGFHKSMAIDPHEVVAILLQYLWELPEPLFTSDRWEAFVRIGKLENEQVRIRSLQRLLNDLPWYHKPLLERLVHLFSRALQPENAAKNGIDVHMLAILLAPITLRSTRRFRFSDMDDPAFRRFPVAGHTPVRNRLPISFYGADDSIEAERAAAEARAFRMAKRQAEEGACVLEILLTNQNELLSNYRGELDHRRRLLKRKVDTMESIREKLRTPINLSNSEHVDLLKKLWQGLVPVSEEDAQQEPDFPSDDLSLVDTDTLLKSKRWKASGFHTENPMGGFRGGGLLSLECMAFFVHEYPEKAQSMMKRNALPGGTRYPFPVACINVMRMMTKLVMVDEPPATPSRLILHSETGMDTILEMQVAERVSRTPFWRVFDDPKAFEKLHSMAFMLLDLHWIRCGATQMGFNPVLDSTRRQMGWLLEQAPRNMDEMWKTWMQKREQHASKFAPATPVVNEVYVAEQCRNHDDELALQIARTLDRSRVEERNELKECDGNSQRTAIEAMAGNVHQKENKVPTNMTRTKDMKSGETECRDEAVAAA